MGMCPSRNRGSYAWEKNPKMFIQKMKLLQQEINAILKRREEDNEAYEREVTVFAFREAEWKRERKTLREEVKRLNRRLDEREERIRQMEDEVDMNMTGKNDKVEGQSVESSAATASLMLIEQMREERAARRDEAAEKWKMLYLAIKNELDDLIHRTHQGTLYWRADEEDFMEELQRELKAKAETIEVLKAQIASMENEEYKRKREMDILRQSLKIMSSKGTTSKHVKKRSKPSIRLTSSLSKLAFVN